MIWLASLLVAASLSDATPDVAHWRLLLPDSQVVALDDVEAPPAELARRARGAWGWRQGGVPRRVEIRGVAPTLPALGELERLEVRVRGPGGRPFEGPVELLAAPAAMWQEVPEPLLPRVAAVLPTGRIEVVRETRVPYRVRALAAGWGSAWIEIPASAARVEVRLEPAADRRVRVLGSAGTELAAAELDVLALPGALLLARFAPGSSRLEVPALPDTGALAWVVSAPGHLPRRLDLRAEALPPVLRLEPSFTVRGRFLDGASSPISEVEIAGAAELALAVPYEVVRTARTDATGRFELTGLPAGAIGLVARKEGFATLRATVELPARAEGLDLGTVTMARATPLAVRVRDARAEPVVGAAVSGRPEIGAPAVTDDSGLARLAGAAPGSELELEIRAEGYLPGRLRARVEADREVVCVLRAAFLLRGRFLDAAGSPVEHGKARVVLGGQIRSLPLGAGGELELELPPGQGGRVTLASPRTAELSIDFAEGEPGEIRDLGELRAPPSRRVVGEILDADTGAPVVGAKVSAPRPDGRHPMESWFFGRWLETQSDAEGRFELGGFTELPARLEIDAARHARRVVEVAAAAEEEVTDLGILLLTAGTSVVVRVPELDPVVPEASVQVRLDPGLRWQEYEMLRAPLVAGEARFFDVAAGRVLVTAVAGREVICETELEVVAGTEQPQEAECRPGSLEVAGLVRVGREPAGPGTLIWLSAAPSGPGFIVESAGGLGDVRSQIVGGGRPQVDVPVAPEGRFRSRHLSPGAWNVLWNPEGGAASRPLAVEVPDVEGTVELVLDFAAGEIAGTVVDRDQIPIAGATVTEKGSGTTAVSGADGRFRLLGLEPGMRIVQAQARGGRSAATRVELDPAGTTPPIELVVPSEEERETVRVVVEGVDGRALPGVFLFAQTTRGETLVLTAGADGAATLEMEAPAPDAVRFAILQTDAGLLGDWLGWQRIAGEEVVLRPSPTARLVVTSEHAAGPIELQGPGGWDIGDLLRRLGIPLLVEGGAPVVLASLPSGDYLLRAPGRELALRLLSGETTELALGGSEAP